MIPFSLSFRRFLLTLCVLFLISGFLASNIQAAEPVVLEEITKSISLGANVDFFIDASASLTLDEAIKHPGWQPLAQGFGFGFIRKPVWFRIKVNTPYTTDRRWVLEIGNTLLESVSLYTPNKNDGWDVQAAGRSIPHSQWPMNTKSPAFTLDTPSGEQTLYLRISTRNALSTWVTIWDVNSYYVSSQNEALLNGMYFGACILVIFFQLSFWLKNREPISGWYVPYATMILVLSLLQAGIPANQFDIDGEVAVLFNGIIIALSVGVLCRFTSVVLDLDNWLPKLSFFLHRIFYGVSVISVTLILSGYYWVGLTLAQVSMMVWIVIGLSLAIYLLKKGYQYATFYLIAFGVFDIGVVIRSLRNYRIVDATPFTEYSFTIASVTHLALMGMFIVYRYDLLKKALQIEKTAHEGQRDFVAMVSHEFRTPVAIIRTSAQQIANNLSASAEKTASRCQNIVNAAGRLVSLLDSYLASERLEYASESLNLSEVAPQTFLEICQSEWPEVNITLHCAANAPHFYGDQDMLQLAIRNLISNALRYGQTEHPIRLELSATRNKEIRFSVTNAGRPIPEAEQTRIFERYVRGRNSQKITGAGLGLYLVRQIAMAHQGNVGVVCSENETTFWMQLPTRNTTTS